MLQRAPVWMVELALTWEVTDLPRVMCHWILHHPLVLQAVVLRGKALGRRGTPERQVRPAQVSEQLVTGRARLGTD